MGNLPADFMFSQSSLQDFVDCPRRFELKYLLKQRFPAPEVDDMLAFEQRMEQGQLFHQLVHQHQVGIPSEMLKKRINDEQVHHWFETYLNSAVDALPQKRYPEKTLTIPFAGYGLLAKIDLLAIGDTIQIIDWKTSRRLPHLSTLQKRLQTRVYRYVVATGSAYLNGGATVPPEQIEMVYWYTEHDGESIRLPYSQEQFEADEAYLTQLVDDIDNTASFPLTDDENRCKFCTYRSLCDRGREAGSISEWDNAEYDAVDLDDFDIDFEQIAEIEF